MTGKQKRYLRALASTMPAVVMIGKGDWKILLSTVHELPLQNVN